ncbi:MULTISPECIES: VOC family protein [unclassified Caulobacter]|uniref:VOC family protein n=1 Tax=unclassified Caulobacter TaxID=2648921 RepID=UPI000D38C844|nr:MULTISPECIES: VOC family protein [unclassified Caulobacter]PTS91289.1 glyoxalase [Caulobacter sp. HMWF009]PTT12493.1 glyoxalase [Caulobacter sp. HMWF025]
MARVLGLGGIFFKAADPAVVRDWYARVLGFEIHDWGGVIFDHPKLGVANWSPFPADTQYFEPSKSDFMINFIVDDLDGVLARAAAEGVEPTGRQDEDMGRFAWLMDPAGVKIELWQPAEAASGA